MGQRSEPNARRRPTRDQGQLRATDAQRPGTSGRTCGAFCAHRWSTWIRKTHAGQRSVHRVGGHAVRLDFGQHRGKISRKIGTHHVASSRQQSGQVGFYYIYVSIIILYIYM